MNYGTSTVTFKRKVKVGPSDALGEFETTTVDTNATGCRHRPLTFDEVVTLELDVATQWWRTTLPIHQYDGTILAAIELVAPDDVIEVDGQEYQIHGGVRSHPDLAGNPFKATIISKKQIG